MKKSAFAIFAATFAAGTMMLSSCANKTPETTAEQTKAEVTEQETAATEEEVIADGDQLTETGKEALLNSKLVSDADFNKTIFIDFNATWCGPCQQFAPYFEAAAEKYADSAKFIAVDIDQYGDIANAFKIESIPTMIAIMPNGKYITYVGTTELVGDGAFEGIVNKYIR